MEDAMSQRLAGKAALIIGGARGIGAATGKLFCRQGAQVLLVDREAADLRQAAESLRREVPGAKVESFCADIWDAEQCAAAVRHASQALGRPDTVVNNAGIRIPAAIADVGIADWRKILDVHLLGAVSISKTALPLLRAAGRASIVNVSSCYAETGRQNMGLYDATKAALLALTRTLAFEEADRGIRVNAVCPGSTLSEYHAARGKSRTEVRSDSLLHRWAEPLDVVTSHPLARLR
jgi:meso-butanediol dehydrogenase/(S,S)-butanediol dehydrogenase/diacetyl reductase